MTSIPRIAVITGASRGLGLETARGLAAKGQHVILTARTKTAVAKGLKALGDADAEGRVLDVADDASVKAFFTWLKRARGRIDVLVNNAGRLPGGYEETMADVAPADILKLIDNNALSAYRMTARALPMMNAAGHGRIVNVSSGLGQLSDMGGGVICYRFSKTALNVVTRIAHAEAQASGNGDDVKVNSVCPGWVRTDMGGPSAPRALDEGVASILWAATLPKSGPSGGFFRDGKRIDW
jgi:NAD(P)-dependent dehydrogenase (short-subunit alcohol dehydrogenase family)